MEGAYLGDTVTLAADAKAVADRVIATCEEHSHVREAAPRILYLASERAIPFRGGYAWAVIVQPRWQGPLGLVAEFLFAQLLERQDGIALDPDYAVIVDAVRWRSLDAEGRERLMFHELAHLQVAENEFGVQKRHNDGRPMLKLVPHDFELFQSEIERYGVVVCNADDLPGAIVNGEARRRRRGLRLA